MARSFRFTSFMVTGAALLSLACMGSGDGAAAQRTLAAMKQRDISHHDASAVIGDTAGLRSDTARYAEDMGRLVGEMREQCDKMMDSGMMGSGSMDSMHGSMRKTMDQMMDSIRDHGTRMDAMDSVDDMRKQCDEHHKAMADMLNSMDGMMGSGMGGMM